MKVIFLDIDGVLAKFGKEYSSPFRIIQGQYTCMEPELVFILNKLVDKTDCELVLSSSWRHDPKWREIMKASGIIKPFLDCTATKTKVIGGHNGGSKKEGTYQRKRGNVIKAWLREHPEVVSYAILDDDEDAGYGHPQENFFKTDVAVGITEQHAQAIENLFNSITP